MGTSVSPWAEVTLGGYTKTTFDKNAQAAVAYTRPPFGST